MMWHYFCESLFSTFNGDDLKMAHLLLIKVLSKIPGIVITKAKNGTVFVHFNKVALFAINQLGRIFKLK